MNGSVRAERAMVQLARPAPPALQRLFAEYQKRQIVLRSLQAEFRNLQDEAMRRRTIIGQAQRSMEEAYDDLQEVMRKWTTAVELARRIRQMGPPREPREVYIVQSLERQLLQVAQEVGVSPKEVYRYV